MNKEESLVKTNLEKPDDNIEYNASGAVVIEPEKTIPKKNVHVRRNILLPTTPKIYVNDGSNGTNLVNTYSYKNYCEANERPSYKNNYHNNFKTALTSNPEYCAIDGLRLHPTGDSGGWSNFTISQFIPQPRPTRK